MAKYQVMKKCILLLVSLVTMSRVCGAEFVKDPPLRACEIFLAIGKTAGTISLLDLAYIKPRAYAIRTGEKMTFGKRIAFGFMQRKLRDLISPEGFIYTKNIPKQLQQIFDGATGFHLGGFALGFFLGGLLIGLVIPYIFQDNKRKNRIKWAWIGFATLCVLMIVLVASGFVEPFY